MPPLKQPVPLVNMCMDFLVNRLSNYCHEASTEGSLETLREGITIIKEEICPYMNWYLSAEFHNRFLQEFFRPERPRSHKRAVLEIIMDRKIIGLSCAKGILDVLDEEDLHRIQGLIKLEWTYSFDNVVRSNPEKLHLAGLKKVVFENNCTNTHLQLIGRNCPMLEYLDAEDSEGITDEGLLALNKCPELQVVRVPQCSGVSRNGIHELLSAHKKIRRIHVSWSRNYNEAFNCLSHSDSSVYPSIDTFDITNFEIPNEDLLKVVKKVPNLISLELYGHITADLRTLSSLKKLTKLDLSFAIEFNYDDLKQLLVLIGANITDLRTRGASTATQEYLDFLFNNCGNIESLDFKYQARLDGGILAIPPFPKLRVLECVSEHRYGNARLVFDRMPNLERLTIDGFHMTAESVEEMVLDNAKFPNLELMRTCHTLQLYDINRIRDIAKSNNLDFEIRSIWS